MPAPAFGAPPAPESRRAEAAAPPDRPAAAGSQAPLARERLGTGHGARETDVMRVVAFQRASAHPDQRLEIRYDSYENLAAAGIVPPPRVAHDRAARVPRRCATTSPTRRCADPTWNCRRSGGLSRLHTG